MRYIIDSVEYDSTIGAFFCNGDKWKLSAMGTRVLNYFLQHPDELISYQQLMDDVWQTVVSENAVIQILTHIRQTFKQTKTGSELIITLRAQGFLLNSELGIKAAPEKTKMGHNIAWLVAIAVVLFLVIYQWYITGDERHGPGLSAAQASRLMALPAFEINSENSDENLAIQTLMSEILQLSGNPKRPDSLEFPLSEEKQQEAFEQLVELTEMMDEKSNPQAAAAIFFTMSRVYQHQKQYNQASTYLNRTLNLLQQRNDPQRLGLVHYQLADLAWLMGDLQQAHSHYQVSLKMAQQLKKPRILAGVLNKIIKLKIKTGQFDDATSLNEKMSDIAQKANLFNNQVRVAQWHAILSLETEQLQAAEQYIKQHTKLSQQSNSKLLIDSNLLLQLRLALARKEIKTAEQLVIELNLITDNPTHNQMIIENYIPLYVEYLTLTDQAQKLLTYLMAQKEQALAQKNPFSVQHLEILLAKQYVKNAPNTAMTMLQNMKINDLNAHPYYSLLAEALYATGEYEKALVAIEKAKKHYHQRWGEEEQQLYQKTQQALTDQNPEAVEVN